MKAETVEKVLLGIFTNLTYYKINYLETIKTLFCGFSTVSLSCEVQNYFLSTTFIYLIDHGPLLISIHSKDLDLLAYDLIL